MHHFNLTPTLYLNHFIELIWKGLLFAHHKDHFVDLLERLGIKKN
jgi:hypothetical protein